MKRPGLIIWLLSCALSGAYAQKTLDKDTFSLKEVELTGTRRQDKDLMKTIRMDSSLLADYSSANLTDLLAGSSVYVKNYGPGMVASSGFRGTAEDHTKIYWNGIALNSSMYGIQDLNLVPVFLLNGVEINYGGASLNDGSGGFGGSLNLQSHTGKASPGIELNTTAGSFGSFGEGLGAAYGGKKMWGATKIYYQAAQNNFPYINTYKWGRPQETETDAATLRYGLLQTFGWQISPKDILTATAWYQYSFRNLPQTMISNKNHEYQKDISWRNLVDYTRYENKYALDVSGSFVHEYLFYHNEQEDLDAPSQNDRYEIKSSVRPVFAIPLSMEAGLSDLEETAQVHEYFGKKTRNRMAAWVNTVYPINTAWKAGLMLRGEAIDFEEAEPAFLASLSWKPLKDDRLGFYCNGGRNFNVPNLNDLYWYPGGNPALKPEYDWQGEAGIRSALSLKPGMRLESGLTVFSNFISNYILWSPSAGSYWQAQNLKTVWARGMEASLKYSLHRNTWTANLDLGAQVTPSTSDANTSFFPANGDSQLIYVPLFTAQGGAGLAWKTWDISMEETWAGVRNTTDMALPGYALADVSIGKGLALSHFRVHALAACHNLFNQAYQAILWRPMPGRWYDITLKITFTK